MEFRVDGFLQSLAVELLPLGLARVDPGALIGIFLAFDENIDLAVDHIVQEFEFLEHLVKVLFFHVEGSEVFLMLIEEGEHVVTEVLAGLFPRAIVAVLVFIDATASFFLL